MMESEASPVGRGKGLLRGMGVFWLVAGILLLRKGLHFLATLSSVDEAVLPIASPLASIAGGLDGAGLLIIAGALALGAIKGRFALRKVAFRLIERVRVLPSDASVSSVFGVGYVVLIAGAMTMGWTLNHFGIPTDVRGLVDVAVGSALANSSLVFLRA